MQVTIDTTILKEVFDTGDKNKLRKHLLNNLKYGGMFLNEYKLGQLFLASNTKELKEYLEILNRNFLIRGTISTSDRIIMAIISELFNDFEYEDVLHIVKTALGNQHI